HFAPCRRLRYADQLRRPRWRNGKPNIPLGPLSGGDQSLARLGEATGTDILTDDGISLLRRFEKKPLTSTVNFTHKRYNHGDETLHQALIATPEHAGHPVRDNRPRESCAEGCWGRRRMK